LLDIITFYKLKSKNVHILINNQCTYWKKNVYIKQVK